MKIKNFLIVLVCFFMAILFFTNVEIVLEAINRSSKFCFYKIIPSLFPYMIICSFILYSSALGEFFNTIKNGFFNYFGICRKCFESIILGSLCGFVTGAKAINELPEKNGFQNYDLTKEVTLSSNAGIGFVIGCVGIQIWGSFSFGIFIYLSQLIVAFFLSIFWKREKIDLSYNNEKTQINISSAFTKAVSSSALSLISICAFFVFFSFSISVFTSLFPYPHSENLQRVLNIFFEFTKGTFFAVSFKQNVVCGFFTGFCIGFGGICAHFQIFSVCDKIKISKLKFFIFKFFQGILTGLLCSIYVFILDISPTRQTFNYEFESSQSGVVFLIFALLSIFLVFIKKQKKI